MPDEHTERAIRNERKRHTDQVRQLAERIQEQAGFVLARLDKGAGLVHFSLVADAVELERRVAMLEAIDDVTGIYESEPQHSKRTEAGNPAATKEQT